MSQLGGFGLQAAQYLPTIGLSNKDIYYLLKRSRRKAVPVLVQQCNAVMTLILFHLSLHHLHAVNNISLHCLVMTSQIDIITFNIHEKLFFPMCFLLLCLFVPLVSIGQESTPVGRLGGSAG